MELDGGSAFKRQSDTERDAYTSNFTGGGTVDTPKTATAAQLAARKIKQPRGYANRHASRASQPATSAPAVNPFSSINLNTLPQVSNSFSFGSANQAPPQPAPQAPPSFNFGFSTTTFGGSNPFSQTNTVTNDMEVDEQKAAPAVVDKPVETQQPVFSFCAPQPVTTTPEPAETQPPVFSFPAPKPVSPTPEPAGAQKPAFNIFTPEPETTTPEPAEPQQPVFSFSAPEPVPVAHEPVRAEIKTFEPPNMPTYLSDEGAEQVLAAANLRALETFMRKRMTQMTEDADMDVLVRFYITYREKMGKPVQGVSTTQEKPKAAEKPKASSWFPSVTSTTPSTSGGVSVFDQTPKSKTPITFSPAPSQNTSQDDDEAADDTDKENDATATDEQKEAQVSLMDSRPGEENEDVLHEVRAKLMKQDEETKEWKSMGVGPLRVLKNKETGKSRVVLRSDPGAAVILNSSLRSGISYKPLPGGDKGAGTIKFADVNKDGKLESLVLKVKTQEMAQKLSEVLEEAKAV